MRTLKPFAYLVLTSILGVLMGAAASRGEEEIHRRFYQLQGIPVIGVIDQPGTVEAGDCVWLDSKSLLVGLGFRTNPSGVHQLREILSPYGTTIHAFDLPVVGGADRCLHLMSLISLLDYDLALVYEPLLPVRLRQRKSGSPNLWTTGPKPGMPVSLKFRK